MFAGVDVGTYLSALSATACLTMLCCWIQKRRSRYVMTPNTQVRRGTEEPQAGWSLVVPKGSQFLKGPGFSAYSSDLRTFIVLGAGTFRARTGKWLMCGFSLNGEVEKGEGLLKQITGLPDVVEMPFCALYSGFRCICAGHVGLVIVVCVRLSLLPGSRLWETNRARQMRKPLPLLGWMTHAAVMPR